MSTALKEVIQAAVTQAVTQAVADAKVAAHPVGSYYWSSESTDPSTLFGGTWERVKDRFVLAAGDSYAVGATGGEATHTLSYNEMPLHPKSSAIEPRKPSWLWLIKCRAASGTVGRASRTRCSSASFPAASSRRSSSRSQTTRGLESGTWPQAIS